MFRPVFLRCANFHVLYSTSLSHTCKRCFAVVGNQTVDKALTTITGGRIDSWLQKYEELVGLTEVKEAQHKVIEVVLLSCVNYVYYYLTYK